MSQMFSCYLTKFYVWLGPDNDDGADKVVGKGLDARLRAVG